MQTGESPSLTGVPHPRRAIIMLPCSGPSRPSPHGRAKCAALTAPARGSRSRHVVNEAVWPGSEWQTTTLASVIYPLTSSRSQ